jgi:type I restriction enzyme, S subunit
MASEFPLVSIGDLVDRGYARLQTGPFGSQLHKHDYTDAGVPVIPTEGIGRGRIAADAALPLISEAKAGELSRHRLMLGDILFARRGIQATGLSAIVDQEHVGSICGTGALLLRVDPEAADPKFLAAYLSTAEAFDWLRSNAVGAVMPNLNTSIISRLRVPLPPKRVQAAVGQFFGSLDDRIDLLRQTNATLEAIAAALFKSWFVDFDPVRAKAEGREPAGMDAATAALFPSEFEESEQGLIPKGWQTGCLGGLVELKYGKALKAVDRRPGSIPVYGSGGITGSHDVPLVIDSTIIVGRKGTVGSLYWESAPSFPIDTVFYVAPKVSLHFIYFAMMRMGLEHLNTDAAVPGLNRDNAYRQAVVVPSSPLLQEWHQIADPYRARIDQGSAQAETLYALRDNLLPRLISGKLRLPEAEKMIDEAVAA